ncbi:unnamed protein product [Vitrella brassicaformis CCMP3155]|uniref:Uncharacterized protein n=1 Tax=Vitrella brassicaformis (strain CCMP3155) TaxID=1169540 RepID=A0A0G4EW51_VITBC|nr:unnamed protein product [Vitrella brassicaformis CCMP3155]|eukprot:CEM02468.1 unnamed protein product [Vitrella brassicaformis CCMP3155]
MGALCGKGGRDDDDVDIPDNKFARMAYRKATKMKPKPKDADEGPRRDEEAKAVESNPATEEKGEGEKRVGFA